MDIDTDTDNDGEENTKKYKNEEIDKYWDLIFSTAITVRAKSQKRCKVITEEYQNKEKKYINMPRTRFNQTQMMYVRNYYKKQIQEENDLQAHVQEVIQNIHI
jgi:hypothetical protein